TTVKRHLIAIGRLHRRLQSESVSETLTRTLEVAYRERVYVAHPPHSGRNWFPDQNGNTVHRASQLVVRKREPRYFLCLCRERRISRTLKPCGGERDLEV